MFLDTVQDLGIIAVQPNAPTNPNTGDGWLQTPGNILKVFNGFTWVAVGGAGGGNPLVSGVAHDMQLDLQLQDGTVITVTQITDAGRY